MIENVYSNMGKTEGEYPVSGRKPPKNVRQIGFFTGDFRIYLEDYVHTFTHWLAEQNHTEKCVAVFVGEFAKSEHAREVYAYGAVVAEHACDSGKIEMTAQVWTKIYETIKAFFPDGEIVGWFCGGTSFTDEEREEIRQVHLDHFAGTDRILMLYDFLDREEEFYRYEEGGMVRQEGYYIYYEKNTEMQDYMIEQKQGKGSEENVNDRAVKEMRTRWGSAEKKEAEEEVPVKQEDKASAGESNRFLYSVGIIMSAVAIIAAASMLYNQERLKGFEQTLNKLIGNVDTEEEPDTQETAGRLEGENKVQADKEGGDGPMSWNMPGKGDGEKEDTKTGTKAPDNTGEEVTPTMAATLTPAITEEPPSVTPAPDGEGGEDKEPGNPTGEEKGGAGSGKNGKDDGESKPASQKDAEGEKTTKPEKDGNGEEDGSVQTAEIGGPGPAVDTSDMQFYIVQPGDTLVGICRKLYGNLDNLEYIKGLNQLNDGNLIYVDQELLVP